MKLTLESLKTPDFWKDKGVELPRYSVEQMRKHTARSPVWVHFGAGNIFRGFIASLQQKLLDEKVTETGIVAVETFDPEVIHRIYEPYDNLTLNVTLHADGTMSKGIIASVAEAVCADGSGRGQMERLREIFGSPGLQLVSFTITEKGYDVTAGGLRELEKGPDGARQALAVVTAMLWHRFLSGGWPLALVSMDNLSHNGDRLKRGVIAAARTWLDKGFVEEGFLNWLMDEEKVTFPWTMIDKITPRPHGQVEKQLCADGIEGMESIVTARNTYIAAFVNAERPQYLVVEDRFPNGRPPLELAGVFFCSRETVDCAERMKVTACLNPLHTAMSVYGCLLGYSLISDEMRDPDIVALIRRLGYTEGLKTVRDPLIIRPEDFLDEVIEQRLPNPFLPDTPQRIATDTSQKVGIRFGETIKSYIAAGEDLNGLVAIPLAIAGWMRYLLAVDDKGEPMEVSGDPLKEKLQNALAGIVPGRPETYTGQLKNILSDSAVFGLDLTAAGLSGRIETMFIQELAGAGAVRETLKNWLYK